MPVTINDVEIMTDDGKLTDDFKPEILGEEYKESKYFETTPDIVSLMKSAVDTKAKMGKAILPPSEKATDEQKAEYRNKLKKELGAPETVDAYEFIPLEGVTHSEELVNNFKQAFLDEGIPVDSATRLVQKWDEYVLKQMKDAEEKENNTFNEQVKEFKTKHPGDKTIIGSRTALKAMIQFGNKELINMLKEGKVLDKPDDFDALRKIDIWPVHLSMWERIGEKMKSDAAITNEGEVVTKVEKEPEAGSKEAVIKKMYDHPSSVADRQARGKEY